MATATRSTVRKTKPARKCSLKANVLSMTFGEGEKTTTASYRVESLPCDCGKAFTLTKLTSEGADAVPYDLLLSKLGDRCECLGWLRWSRCRHVAAMRALFAAGRI